MNPKQAIYDETGLDQLDLSKAKITDTTHFRAIISANDKCQQANQELIEAVRQARQAGNSWFSIGVALGTTKQAAHKRFAHII